MGESPGVSPTVLILASASPRRAELLRAAGIAFEVVPADVDERILPGEGADAYARRVAEAKARTITARGEARPVLSADTVVVVGDDILGKPTDRGDAERMLRLLSGRTHRVVTAVTLATSAAGGDQPRLETRLASTAVELAPLSEAEIRWYVASGEPTDKAGAYAIQGLASRFVTRIEGSYSNVVGLPVSLVYQMCTDAGLLLS
jgi:septum formation protein